MAAVGCHAEAEISVAIGDDEWIGELNRKYRSREEATDVLAFPQDISPGGHFQPLGDVAVSWETAERQARKAGHNLMEELELLLAHGILHLTGWRDETPGQRRRMRRRAQGLLSQVSRESRPSRGCKKNSAC